MGEQGERHIGITDHSRKRTKNRLGLSKKDTEKVANKALDFGITHADAKGNLRKYMDGLYLRYQNGNNNRVYNRKVYIFQGMVLITILNLPHNLSALADSLQKKLGGAK